MTVETSREQRLQGLRTVADSYRRNPEWGRFIREFEKVLDLIREIETEGYSGADAVTAAQEELTKIGNWMPIKKLAFNLHKQNVLSPATRNPRAKERKRRPLANAERLERQILQAINYSRFIGYKSLENGRDITYVGLNEWVIPGGVRRIEPRPKRTKSGS